MEKYYWIVTVASIVGVVANVHKRGWCFAVWMVTNALWFWHDFNKGEMYQAALFAVYFVLAVWGLIKWTRGKRGKKQTTEFDATLGKYNFFQKWHEKLNDICFSKGGKGHHAQDWIYESKRFCSALPRMVKLFESERTGKLTTVHKQCSISKVEKVVNNHLTCCLGTECAKCELLTPFDSCHLKAKEVDIIKAWTCGTHILHECNKRFVDTTEGYIMTVDDRMFWDKVYDSLSWDGR